MTYSFQTKDEPDEPQESDGYFTWVFVNGDRRLVVPADSRDDAWRGLHYHKSEDWYQWTLKGREDLIKKDLNTPEVSARFAQRCSETDDWS